MQSLCNCVGQLRTMCRINFAIYTYHDFSLFSERIVEACEVADIMPDMMCKICGKVITVTGTFTRTQKEKLRDHVKEERPGKNLQDG